MAKRIAWRLSFGMALGVIAFAVVFALGRFKTGSVAPVSEAPRQPSTSVQPSSPPPTVDVPPVIPTIDDAHHVGHTIQKPSSPTRPGHPRPGHRIPVDVLHVTSPTGKVIALDPIPRPATVAYAVPDVMYVNQEHHVSLTISLDDDVDALLQKLQADPSARKGGEGIVLPSPELSATLDGDPDKFAIGLVDGLSAKKVEKGLEATWKWRVRPKSTGTYELTLTVFSPQLPNGRSIFKQPVAVKVGASGAWSTTKDNLLTYVLSGAVVCGGLVFAVKQVMALLARKRLAGALASGAPPPGPPPV